MKALRTTALVFGTALATLAVLVALGMIIAPAQAAVSVGRAAPDFAAVSASGKTHRLSDYRGRMVVLEWTNHDCPYVRKHYESGNMQRLQKEAAAQGIVWLSIISSAPGKQGHVSPDQARALTKARSATPEAVLFDPDGKIGRAYGAKTTPHMYIVNPEGELVYMGGIDDKPTSNPAHIETSHNYVRAALTELAANQPVSKAATRPYGCSVKYPD